MVDITISDLVFKQLQAIPENTKCFDCGKHPSPSLIPLHIHQPHTSLYRHLEPSVGIREQWNLHMHELCRKPQGPGRIVLIRQVTLHGHMERETAEEHECRRKQESAGLLLRL